MNSRGEQDCSDLQAELKRIGEPPGHGCLSNRVSQQSLGVSEICWASTQVADFSERARTLSTVGVNLSQHHRFCTQGL